MFATTNRTRLLVALAPGIGFTYVLSLIFEGPVLYSLCGYYGVSPGSLVMTGIIAQFAGLLTCGFLVRSAKTAKRAMLGGFAVCFAASFVFFLPPSGLWYLAIAVCSVAAAWMLAAWGCFLKIYVERTERIKVCAELLIISNILLITIQFISAQLSAFIGLALALAMLPIGFFLTWKFPATDPGAFKGEESLDTGHGIAKPMGILYLFVTVITINSGLMYQVLNPAYAHLTWLVSWYWAIPYVVALLIIRNLPLGARRATALYVAMGMMMASFLAFMLTDQTAGSYFIVDTLMLGACGVFDLFWWSILAEMMDHGKNPVQVFGIGLSANVLGIIIGSYIAQGITGLAMPEMYTTVIALTVVCVTLVILPPLNRWLTITLKTHTYLNTYAHLPKPQQEQLVHDVKTLEPLTERESDVLKLVLAGKANRDIAGNLSISENTVKTHLRNVYQKYDVSSRAELISILLRNQQIP